MAVRPFAFGVRLRDQGRTVKVRQRSGDARGYVLEDTRKRGGTRRRDHASLEGALRDLARTWRKRLN